MSKQQEVSKVIFEYLQSLENLPTSLTAAYSLHLKYTPSSKQINNNFKGYADFLAVELLDYFHSEQQKQELKAQQQEAILKAKAYLNKAQQELNNAQKELNALVNCEYQTPQFKEFVNGAKLIKQLNNEVNNLITNVGLPINRGTKTGVSFYVTRQTVENNLKPSFGDTECLKIETTTRQGKQTTPLIHSLVKGWFRYLEETPKLSKNHPVFKVAELLLGGNAENHRKTYSNSVNLENNS